MTISRRTILISAIASTLAGKPTFAASAPPVRIGTLRFGTASWELEVIRRNGFDKARGIVIEAVEFASSQATQVALQAGRVDMILVDWLWVARQRAEGADWTFAPFSSSVGALVAPPSSLVKSVADLKGARLGIAGSPLDKSWLILQAYGKQKLGLDLDKVVTKNFGAPPLLAEQLKQGQLDAMLTFWPFVAKAEAAGMHRILGIDEAVKALGIAATIPFVGYVFSTAWAKVNQPVLDNFLTATRQAQGTLEQSDEIWQQLMPVTGAADLAELAELKKAYRSGIVHQWGLPELNAIEALYKILADIGGPALVGSADFDSIGHVLAAGQALIGTETDSGAQPRQHALPIKLISLAVLAILWEGLGRALDSRLLPPASAVIAAMWREAVDGPLVFNLAITLGRVTAAFLAAMISGTIIGMAMGSWKRLDTIFDFWLTVLLNLPALVLIILIYIWFGLTEFSIVFAVALNKLPSTAVIVREGARKIERSLMDMAASFRLGRIKTFRHVFLPQLYPYLIAAARSGLALIWKIVLVAEILGRSSGVGFEIEIYFQLFDVTHILAYSLAFILVVQLIEWGLLQPLERRASWSRA